MLRRIGLGWLFILIFSILCLGQTKEEKSTTYEVSKKLDYKICGAGLIIGGADLLLSNKAKPLSRDEILGLDRSEINSFDRAAVDNWSTKSGDASDVLEYFAVALPATIMFSQNARDEWDKILLMYGETFLINVTLTTLIKLTTKRTRPFIYNQELPIEIKLGKTARNSFYSGHTSHAAAMSFFTAKVFTDFYSESKLKPLVWTLATAYPIAMGYLRVDAGKHFPTDVIVGAISGGLIGYLIPQLHKTNPALSKGLSLATDNGLGIAYRF